MLNRRIAIQNASDPSAFFDFLGLDEGFDFPHGALSQSLRSTPTSQESLG
jgi:hypothetical protein